MSGGEEERREAGVRGETRAVEGEGNPPALELKELEGVAFVCYKGACIALELSNDARGTYGDTAERPVGSFVLVDYESRWVFLGATIEDCFEAWLQRRLGTSERFTVLAADVRERRRQGGAGDGHEA